MHRYIMSLLIILLSDSGCCTSRRVQQVEEDSNKPMALPTPHPRVNPRKPPLTHISEFTDPDTGLNPFLDIEEGRVNDAGRNFEDEDEQDLVADLPFPDLQPLEDDTSHARGRQEEDTFDTRGRLPDEPTWLWHAEEGTIVDEVSTTGDIILKTTILDNDVSINLQTEGQRTSEQDEMEWSDSRYVTMCLSVAFCGTLLVMVVVGASWWAIRSRRTVRTSDLEENCKLPTK